MALPATAVWEVRPTVGSDTACGGGFDPAIASPGTDYSQQDAAQYTFTDLASISSLVVASASHNFVAADVGNFMQITAGTGFTTGFYEIVSVAANQATLDRSPGTVGVGGTYFVGGALATVSQAVTVMVASNTVWVMGSAGTYLTTAVQTLSSGLNGNAGQPTTFRGYGVTRGDGIQAVWQIATNSTNLVNFSGGVDNFLFRDFDFSVAAGTPGYGWYATGNDSTDITAIGCKWSGGLRCIQGDYGAGYTFNRLILIDCEITGSAGVGVANSSATSMFACNVHDNVGDGFQIFPADVSATTYLSRTVFRANNSGAGAHGGIYCSGSERPLFLENCAFTENTGDGVCNVSSVGILAVNTIFYGNTGYGINQPNSGNQAYIVYLKTCALGANSSGDFNNLPGIINEGAVTLTADPFTNQSAGDFSLNSTAGGGAACKQAGFPTVIP